MVGFSFLLPFVRGDVCDGWENCVLDSLATFFPLVLVGCFSFIWYDYLS